MDEESPIINRNKKRVKKKNDDSFDQHNSSLDNSLNNNDNSFEKPNITKKRLRKSKKAKVLDDSDDDDNDKETIVNSKSPVKNIPSEEEQEEEEEEEEEEKKSIGSPSPLKKKRIRKAKAVALSQIDNESDQENDDIKYDSNLSPSSANKRFERLLDRKRTSSYSDDDGAIHYDYDGSDEEGQEGERDQDKSTVKDEQKQQNFKIDSSAKKKIFRTIKIDHLSDRNKGLLKLYRAWKSRSFTIANLDINNNDSIKNAINVNKSNLESLFDIFGSWSKDIVPSLSLEDSILKVEYLSKSKIIRNTIDDLKMDNYLGVPVEEEQFDDNLSNIVEDTPSKNTFNSSTNYYPTASTPKSTTTTITSNPGTTTDVKKKFIPLSKIRIKL
ncbi:hypothetical protein CYY_002001 [Polysphondylium violaceum]|uniref:Chromosome segregation in meiosis protein 3 domain-containing protein n=1 Tax=Polysphondylium violaceum TaxID=133409 RepID=A0A8J4PYT5_9MYCE|nr:hypothetical protein CYY_002001 [Polysphondylium violaceum]